MKTLSVYPAICSAGRWLSIISAMALISGCTSNEPNADNGGRQKAVVAPSGLALAPLTVESDGALQRFTVEVARTGQEQARGLMFRNILAPDAGMIFPFVEPRQASFWMKDTSLSLDIIFIRSDGSIESIAEHTVPYSLDSVASQGPVAAVLEIPAGRSAQLGIGPGDIVKWGKDVTD